MADAGIFVILGLSSFHMAEMAGCSGIISTLICGIFCNQFAVRNMSIDARTHAHAIFTVLAEISDHMLMLWIGLIYCMSIPTWASDAVGFSLLVLVLVITSRFISVYSIGASTITQHSGQTN